MAMDISVSILLLPATANIEYPCHSVQSSILCWIFCRPRLTEQGLEEIAPQHRADAKDGCFKQVRHTQLATIEGTGPK